MKLRWPQGCRCPAGRQADVLHRRSPGEQRTIEDSILVQHEAVLVAHAEREPHVAKLEQHGLCARPPRSHCSSYSRVQEQPCAQQRRARRALAQQSISSRARASLGFSKLCSLAKLGVWSRCQHSACNRPRDALAAASTHRVKPLPSSRTTIQQPGSSVSSSSNFLTYS